MGYEVRPRKDSWCVVKADTGTVLKIHGTKSDATDHARRLREGRT